MKIDFAKITFGAMGSEVERQKREMLEAGVTGNKPRGFGGRAPRPLGRAEALGAFYSEVNTYLGEVNKQTTRAGFEDGTKFVTELSMAIQHIWETHVNRGDLFGECPNYSIEVRERVDAYDLSADNQMQVTGRQVTMWPNRWPNRPDPTAVTADQIAAAINEKLGGVVEEGTPDCEAIVHWRDR